MICLTIWPTVGDDDMVARMRLDVRWEILSVLDEIGLWTVLSTQLVVLTHKTHSHMLFTATVTLHMVPNNLRLFWQKEFQDASQMSCPISCGMLFRGSRSHRRGVEIVLRLRRFRRSLKLLLYSHYNQYHAVLLSMLKVRRSQSSDFFGQQLWSTKPKNCGSLSTFVGVIVQRTVSNVAWGV